MAAEGVLACWHSLGLIPTGLMLIGRMKGGLRNSYLKSLGARVNFSYMELTYFPGEASQYSTFPTTPKTHNKHTTPNIVTQIDEGSSSVLTASHARLSYTTGGKSRSGTKRRWARTQRSLLQSLQRRVLPTPSHPLPLPSIPFSLLSSHLGSCEQSECVRARWGTRGGQWREAPSEGEQTSGREGGSRGGKRGRERERRGG